MTRGAFRPTRGAIRPTAMATDSTRRVHEWPEVHLDQAEGQLNQPEGYFSDYRGTLTDQRCTWMTWGPLRPMEWYLYQHRGNVCWSKRTIGPTRGPTGADQKGQLDRPEVQPVLIKRDNQLLSFVDRLPSSECLIALLLPFSRLTSCLAHS